jgi:hypothetical protein
VSPVPDNCLIIAPGSLSIVASADASYTGHPDGRSHSRYCVGFKGDNGKPDSYFTFADGKQTNTTLSATESELNCAGSAVGVLVWVTILFQGFGLSVSAAVLYRDAEISDYAPGEPIGVPTLYQGNTAAMHLISEGKGKFKVRYYYIKELVDAGELIVVWCPTAEMVADLLTKGVALVIFVYLLLKLIGVR